MISLVEERAERQRACIITKLESILPYKISAKIQKVSNNSKKFPFFYKKFRFWEKIPINTNKKTPPTITMIWSSALCQGFHFISVSAIDATAQH